MSEVVAILNFQSWKIFMQDVSSIQDLVSKSSPFLSNGKNFSLVPFSKFDLDSDHSLNLLASWRNENIFAYPTRSPITISGTKKWLEKAVLANPNRLLFWIVDSSLGRLGHIGVVVNPVSKKFEIDNVLRGIPIDNPGLMSSALSKIESVIEEEFSIESVCLSTRKQ